MIIKQRYNIMLNPNVVAIIDKISKDEFRSRSEIIGEILLQYINEHDFSAVPDVYEVSGQIDIEGVI